MTWTRALVFLIYCYDMESFFPIYCYDMDSFFFNILLWHGLVFYKTSLWHGIISARNMIKQGTPEWFELRRGCGNSSAFNAMFNVGGIRDRALREEDVSEKFVLSWGTLLENVSGYLFTQRTGLIYEEVGSFNHPLYPKIRGSPDGLGIDQDGKKFVLETKTPPLRTPGHIKTEYIYQMLQNMEVTNSDCAYFNDVRLLPCTSRDLTSGNTARNPETCTVEHVSGPRHITGCVAATNYVTSPDYVTSTSIGPRYVAASVSIPGRAWLGNVFDAYDGRHKELSVSELQDIITKKKISFSPISISTDDVDKWISDVFDLSTGNGIAYFAIASHVVKRVPRNTEFWDKVLRPVALAWIEDYERVRNGGDPTPFPITDSLPLPDEK